MKNYILRRLLLFLPVLFTISILVFGLGQLMPGDAVERMVGPVEDFSGAEQYHRQLENYRQTRNQLGLNLPLFYFSILPVAINRDLKEVPFQNDQRRLRSMMLQKGRPDLVINFYISSNDFSLSSARLNGADCPTTEQLVSFLRQLYLVEDISSLKQLKNKLNNLFEGMECNIIPAALQLEESIIQLLEADQRKASLIPAFYWNGRQNRYHQWLGSAIAGDWGRSMRDGQEVGKKILPAIRYTLLLSFWSILLTFLLGIPAGMYLATSENKQIKKLLRTVLYALYAMPLFWMATLAIVFLTTNEYGSWTKLFPSASQMMLQTSTGSWLSLTTLAYLFLPVSCMALSGAAFVARQMEESALREKEKAYLSMSRLKGNSDKITIFRHWMPNALFPLITLSAAVLPSLISGSVVIEVIFNIPGMGRLLWDSIFAQDWNTIMAILMLGGLLTMLGQLIADILYKKADPRINYD